MAEERREHAGGRFLTASAFSVMQAAKSFAESELGQRLVEAGGEAAGVKLSFHWEIRCLSQVCSQALSGDLYELCTVLLAIDFAFQSLSLP